ncbi:hypothetical protein LG634_02000 [Streptomyces bambusae]|uniref:hypothetical protein n=1 Tax=Streptomyces bambusae TaxID=1550616 RepID=UPI001CFE20FE|nr:hypothetical protein [Streptomyces bambusae]MCB5163619.1 hypothetical protein [Streptomyces bambusae]
MNTSRTPASKTSQAADTLAHDGLIRLISEIDDNGPLQRRMLATTLHGLSRRQLTHATTTGRRLGLLRTGRQLAQHPGTTAEAGPDDEAARTLNSVRAALSQWSGDHGDALAPDPVSARAQDGMELAA